MLDKYTTHLNIFTVMNSFGTFCLSQFDTLSIYPRAQLDHFSPKYTYQARQRGWCIWPARCLALEKQCFYIQVNNNKTTRVHAGIGFLDHGTTECSLVVVVRIRSPWLHFPFIGSSHFSRQKELFRSRRAKEERRGWIFNQCSLKGGRRLHALKGRKEEEKRSRLFYPPAFMEGEEEKFTHFCQPKGGAHSLGLQQQQHALFSSRRRFLCPVLRQMPVLLQEMRPLGDRSQW